MKFLLNIINISVIAVLSSAIVILSIAETKTITYPSGKLKAEYGWDNSKMHGQYTVYLENGQLKVKGMYEEGKQVGVWLTYDENGNEIGRINYDELAAADAARQQEHGFVKKEFDCNSSDSAGQQFAIENYTTAGWIVGSFGAGLGGALPGTALVISLAAASNPEPDTIPLTMDASCYNEGYKKIAKRKRVISAVSGSLTGWGVWTLIVIFAIAPNL